MSETEKTYDEHWDRCSDCRHQIFCETGYRLREAWRTEVITTNTGSAPEPPQASLTVEWKP